MKGTIGNGGYVKVSYLGFEFKLANNVDSGKFFGFVQGKYQQIIPYRGLDRYVFVETDADANIVGLFLTTKDHRRSLEMNRTGFAVGKRTNTPGFDGADVNLFVINPSTNKGLYQYYRSSAPPPIFKGFFHRLHREYVKALIADEKRADPSLSDAKLRKKYKGMFTITMKYKKGDLATVLRDFGEINEMRVGNEAIIAGNKKYRPLKSVWTRCNAVVPFSTKKGISKIKSAITKFAQTASSKAITIVGASVSGQSLSETVNDEQNLEHFGGQQFDDFIDMLPDTTFNDYATCDAIEDMVAERDRHSVYFDAPQ